MELKRHAAALSVSWVAPENLHVTVKFLGNVDAARVPSVIDALRSAVRGHAPFDLEVGGLGAFPSATRARVLWAGLIGGTAPLGALAASVEDALAHLGFPREDRPFSPHITLARVREPRRSPELAEALGVASGRRFGQVAVPDIALMRSDLSPRGARYSTLASIALRPAP